MTYHLNTVTVRPGSQSDAVCQIGCHFHELSLPQLLELFAETATAIQKIHKNSSFDLKCPIEDCLNCRHCEAEEDGFLDGRKKGRKEGKDAKYMAIETWLRINHPEILQGFQDEFEEDYYND